MAIKLGGEPMGVPSPPMLHEKAIINISPVAYEPPLLVAFPVQCRSVPLAGVLAFGPVAVDARLFAPPILRKSMEVGEIGRHQGLVMDEAIVDLNGRGQPLGGDGVGERSGI